MIGPITVHVLHTPGHTPGGITLWVPEADALFTGDTLLKGGAGHTAEPDASLASLRASVERLGQFPDSTQVYPGHGAPTSIGSETWLATLADPTAPVRQWRASSKRRHSGPSV